MQTTTKNTKYTKRTPLLAWLIALSCGQAVAAEKVLIAFASYRERPRHPKVYFYEHDGVANGKVVGSVDPVNQRSDYRPSLSSDGRWCAFASELENQTGRIQLWDVKEKKVVELPKINDSPNAQQAPTLSSDGKLLAFAAWNRPGAGPRWHVLLYDTSEKKLLDIPGLNESTFDHRRPALSGDGKYLAYATNSKGGVGLTDVFLYSVAERKVQKLAAMNSRNSDGEPSLNADGSLIAFVSDRPGSAGGRDICMFDRSSGKSIELPGLNSAAHEQSPSLSADGRFIAFVSERVRGAGERDIYLYDRKQAKLLATPGLNDKTEDFDPCLVVLPNKD